MELLLIIVLRILAPVLILRWPLVGVAVSFLADGIDYAIIGQSWVGAHDYQYLDKFLDVYMIAFAWVASRRWLDRRARLLAAWLFFFRLAGVLLFFISREEYVLFLFPNLFLDFFILYQLYVWISRHSNFIHGRGDGIAVVVVVLIPKLINEYYLHVYHVMPMALPHVVQWFYGWPFLLQLPVYLLLPGSYLGWRLWQHKLKLAKQKAAK